MKLGELMQFVSHGSEYMRYIQLSKQMVYV